MIELRQLSLENDMAEYSMLQELGTNENGFTNEVKGMSFGQFKDWLRQQDDYANARNLPENFIPQTTYFLYVDNLPVGIARIRHHSADFLERQGVGNFGYGIARPHRGKGYGNILFERVLEKCKLLGYSKIKSFVHVDNTASNRVFVKNGALLVGVFNGASNIYETTICKEKHPLDFVAYTFNCLPTRDFHAPDRMGADKIILNHLFYTTKMLGSFFSCIYKNKLRMHVVLAEDTDDFNQEIYALICKTVALSGLSMGKIWISSENKKITTFLRDSFGIALDSEKFYYESNELIMLRSEFHKQFDKSLLEARPYEKQHIDQYLYLLHESMSFKIPPYDYLNAKQHFIKEFETYQSKNAFEAFWQNNVLIGLYWLEGAEIDHLAVAPHYQRAGYGSLILTKAIETVFKNSDTDCAYLFVVGWNSKAFHFYEKYGMKVKAQHQVPYIEA